LLAIYRDSDLKSQQLWDRVQDLHRQAISMEAAVIAAARLEGHDHSAHGKDAPEAATTEKATPDKAAGAKVTAEADKNDNPENKDPNTAAADDKESKLVTEDSKSDDQADKRRNRKNRREDGDGATARNRRDRKAGQQSADAHDDNATGWQGLEGDLNIVAIRVAVAQPDGRVREHLLTQTGEDNDADDSGKNKAFQTCQRQLTQIWKDIHDGHEQLVELEASTIVKVEAQLTEAQLQKLDATQSQASTNPTSQSDDSRR
jgi:hypothetical protein